MTLAELVAAYRRRAVEAAAIGATAPVAGVYDAVIADLAPLTGPAIDLVRGNGTDAGERLLTAREVAERLGCSVRYVYAHAESYPFTVRLGEGRTVRFSATGFTRWLDALARAQAAAFARTGTGAELHRPSRKGDR